MDYQHKNAVVNEQAAWWREQYAQGVVVAGPDDGKTFRWAFGMQGCPSGVVIH